MQRLFYKITSVHLFMMIIVAACIQGDIESLYGQTDSGEYSGAGVQFANVEDEKNDAFYTIRDLFEQRNDGYSIDYNQRVESVEATDRVQVLFVQSIRGVTNQDVKAVAEVSEERQTEESEVIVGDIILLLPGERLETDREVGLLSFTVPDLPEQSLPTFIRPDWDPDITDVPGGCATEIDAYRRILLTWSEDVGHYIFHSINAHRVRMRDSFTHYHPVEGGFDEFYLVQMAGPDARILISEQTDLITNPEQVERDQLDGLIQEYKLEVGDIVYIPRGVIHRGVGGVVAQVITVPGFIPGSEWGVDHHLRAINERLNLSGSEALPFNVEASEEAVIR